MNRNTSAKHVELEDGKLYKSSVLILSEMHQ